MASLWSHRIGLVSLSAAVLLAATDAGAAPVVAFGDSWTASGAPILQAALAAAGLASLSVANAAVPGSTAERWAVTEPMALSNAVTANPDAQWVWLSVGGNDVLDLQMAGMGALAAARNETNLRTILDNLFALHPDVRVVMFGYDYTNFQQSAPCMTQAVTYFGSGITQAQINQIFVRDVGDVMQTVAASYPNVTYVPVWGSLQIAGGGSANASLPSPASFMFDCFHPNDMGYREILDVMVAGYWGAARPMVTLTPAVPSACLGTQQMFTAAGTNIQSYTWRVNGVTQGSGPTRQVMFTQAGGTTVQVIAANRAWTDVEMQVVNVTSCNDAGVMDGSPDLGTPDLGPPDLGTPDLGTPDAGVIDTGVRDAGSMMDIGPRDLGIDGPQLAEEWNVSGGCRAIHVRDGGGWWLLALSATFSSFARRLLRLRRP